MKKNILLIFLFCLLNNCSDFDFVYNTNDKIFLLKDITDISVDGDDSINVYSSLKELIGDNSSKEAKYKLIVISSKTKSAQVIETDATASKFSIKYKILYSLYNLYNNCKVFKKEITTLNDYSAKSAGYSFGTDVSYNEANAQNINKNINKFLSSLNQIPNLNNCVN